MRNVMWLLECWDREAFNSCHSLAFIVAPALECTPQVLANPVSCCASGGEVCGGVLGSPG
jgi:hypothetical protein